MGSHRMPQTMLGTSEYSRFLAMSWKLCYLHSEESWTPDPQDGDPLSKMLHVSLLGRNYTLTQALQGPRCFLLCIRGLERPISVHHLGKHLGPQPTFGFYFGTGLDDDVPASLEFTLQLRQTLTLQTSCPSFLCIQSCYTCQGQGPFLPIGSRFFYGCCGDVWEGKASRMIPKSLPSPEVHPSAASPITPYSESK